MKHSDEQITEMAAALMIPPEMISALLGGLNTNNDLKQEFVAGLGRRIVIDDVVTRMASQKETELDPDSRIRFEAGHDHYIIQLASNGIEIQKRNPDGVLADQIRIFPKVQNSIVLS